jgi:catechol 2,3-dioxygenase-like lactoylglutathione lyase family enzyme
MIKGFNHLTLACKNIDISFDFYHKTLGFKPVVKWDKGAYFIVGDLWFCLSLDSNTDKKNCYTHYAFSIDSKNIESYKARLSSTGVIFFKENSSPGDALYFLDPDGHKIELHAGTLKSRIESKLSCPGTWKNIKWY